MPPGVAAADVVSFSAMKPRCSTSQVSQRSWQHPARVSHCQDVDAVRQDQIDDPVTRFDQFAQIIAVVTFDDAARARLLDQLIHSTRQTINEGARIQRLIFRDVRMDLAQARLASVRPDDPHYKPNSRRTWALSVTRPAALSARPASISMIVSICSASSGHPAVSGRLSINLCASCLNTADMGGLRSWVSRILPPPRAGASRLSACSAARTAHSAASVASDASSGPAVACSPRTSKYARPWLLGACPFFAGVPVFSLHSEEKWLPVILF